MAPPDATLHTVATGRAAETVAQHQNPQDLTFYSAWFCPFNHRLWIALEEKGIPYQYKEVNPYKKEEYFLQINPRGLVPAVEYRGKAIYESLVLLEFLEDAYPSYKPNLLPSDPSDRAHQRIWIDHIAKAVVPALMRLTMTQPNEQEKLETARNELYEALRKLQNEIKGLYFAGDQFTLVDVVIAPWILRDYVSAEHRGFKREDVGEGWVKYAKAIETRDSVCRTMSERDKAKVIYDRYLRGDAHSEAAKAVKAGRPIP
ncbi:glutathione S-transferase [Pisolithus orientalis]|uniref:glutathione S-transferase n=1 Tax=Pisolithus orientalis TaxID=936130 RepID=UPI002224E90B|nr:glutathione S-transferase [Pisolithus orientalis]KAI6007597.1 glutathione S-transferase [Pisolithus orientalis]